MTKRLKLKKKFQFKKKGTEVQHDFYESVKAKLEVAASRIEQSVGDKFTKAKEAFKGLQLLEGRQKVIGWRVAGWRPKNMSKVIEIASDSDDKRRIARVERQAEYLKKKRNQQSGFGTRRDQGWPGFFVAQATRG